MANLQVKGMDDSLYNELKEAAKRENRSVSQEVIHLIKISLASRKILQATPTPAETLLRLAGSWDDDRSAEEIIEQIRDARENSNRLQEGI